MGFTALIDVAIGLTLLYLGCALFVTVANEYVAQLLDMRAEHLKRSLAKLLETGGLEKLVTQNPSFKGLVDAAGKPLSYVDPTVLAQTMVGVLRPAKQALANMQELFGAIHALPESQVKNVLLTVAQSSGDKVERFTENVAQWVDRSLKVLGESYKKNIQTLSFWLGLALAVGFNIDTLHVTAHLYADKEARERLSLAGQQFVAQVDQDVFKKCMAMKLEERKAAPECKPLFRLPEEIAKGTGALGELPIGWNGWKQVGEELSAFPSWYQLQRILGWLLTALAISIGAPFWFDLLNRLVNVRHGVRRPEPEKPTA